MEGEVMRHFGGGRALGAVAIVVGALIAATAPASGVSTSISPLVQARLVGGYGQVLVNRHHYSLYLLTDEKGGTLHCTGGCVQVWLPLLVKPNTALTHGIAVKGKLGHVARGSMWQVTDNSYPLYRYIGDGGPKESHGEGISSYGGTWYLVRARATTAAGSPDT